MTAPVDFAPGDFPRVQAAANALLRPINLDPELEVEKTGKRCNRACATTPTDGNHEFITGPVRGQHLFCEPDKFKVGSFPRLILVSTNIFINSLWHCTSQPRQGPESRWKRSQRNESLYIYRHYVIPIKQVLWNHLLSPFLTLSGPVAAVQSAVLDRLG